MKRERDSTGSGIMDMIQEKLEKLGIDIEKAYDDTLEEGCKVKCVVVTPSLKKSVKDLGEYPRDQVVMVRIDEKTRQTLDAWVATGAVKSRSEAAALFIREGLKVRGSELEKLRSALDEVEQAKSRLHEKAREVFGGDEP